MATTALTGTTMTAEHIFEQLREKGVSKVEAQLVVANWILGNAGALPKSFGFKTPFAGVEPGCTPQFARSFVHQDWVDGEDVVQAEHTTAEDGFNLRFHRIEGDLDSLARDVGQAFACLNSMRASLRTLLDEIQAELNLVYRDIARLSREDRPPIFDPRPDLGGRYLGTTKYFDTDVHVFETAAGKVVLPAVEGVTITPFENPRVQRSQALGEFLVSDRVQEFFRAGAGAVSKPAFLEKFGGEPLSNGETVREAIEIIPAGTRFQAPQALLEGLATREGAAIRTSGLENEAIAVTFGLAGEDKVADAPLDRLEVLPANARAVLAREGVTTVGALAGRDPAETAAFLQGRGVDASRADVGGWLGAAQVLVNVR
jgi:hypothetical protein